MKRYSEEEFLNQVLAIPSVNGVDDEGKLAHFLASYLKDCGLSAVVQEIDHKHANVIAVLHGKTQEKVIWNGHLDTVPYGKLSEWNTTPDQPVKRNGCIYARGASDMKSGLAGMAYALGRMKMKGYVPKQTIYFMGTCDEEKGGLGAKRIRADGLVEEASLILIGEPTGCRIGVAQKGCVWLRVKVKGRTSHGACPSKGVNAIEKGFAVFLELKKRLAELSHPLFGTSTIQITGINGGIAPNMTPDRAELLMDIRLVPGITAHEIVEWAKDSYYVLKENAENLEIEFCVENSRKPIQCDENHFWVKKLEWNLTSEHLDAGHVGIQYFTDASILVQEEKIPVILFGPGEAKLAHTPNEYVELKRYLQYIQILGRLF